MNLSAPGCSALIGVASVALSSCASGMQTEPSSIALASSMVRQTSLARVDVSQPFAQAHPFIRVQKHSLSGAVWVTDAKANQVLKCVASGCTAVGSGWSEPQGIAVGERGDIFVADTLNHRIVELNKYGKNVAVLRDPGEYPTGVDVSNNGTVGVTNMISVSGTDGNVVFTQTVQPAPQARPPVAWEGITSVRSTREGAFSTMGMPTTARRLCAWCRRVERPTSILEFPLCTRPAGSR